MDELIGITPLTTKVVIEDQNELSEGKVGTIYKGEPPAKALSITREYEFIGGQVRFKVGVRNNTNTPLTILKYRLMFQKR